jgi:deoxyribodipyrimidine photolyase-related protein
MTMAAIVYPHQLFADHPALKGVDDVVLVEEPLLFTQYAFHRQKLIFHRASMRRYADQQRKKKFRVHYLEVSELPTTGALADWLRSQKIQQVRYVDPCDDWLNRRLAAALREQAIAATVIDDPCFLTPRFAIDDFTAGREKLHFTEFYIGQRKRLGLLLEKGNKPTGGKWSFDPENRKKLPKGLKPPAVSLPTEDDYVREARQYVRRAFSTAPGDDQVFIYPTDHASARRWLAEFVERRLEQFGAYEDAISAREDLLFHSVLTPMLNVGLLSPQEVVDAVLARAEDVPLNSLEGFVRQVIGWREFVRLVYLARGRRQRTANFWNLSAPMPAAFYDGSTGIEPVDHTIQRVLRLGYCHHIERLMLLGNFMLLCDIHPDAVYQWFMELFIDAYDWVMVPNVYGMSQHADGGLMTTKPYISGSSYVLKMSDFAKGPWCSVWDALYWRFVDRHVDFFAANPRMAVMAKMKDKLGDRMREHHRVADRFLEGLHNR